MAFPIVPNDFKAVIPSPTASLCGKFIDVLLKLPVLVYKFVNFMLNADGTLTTAFQQMITDLTVRPGDLLFSAAPLDESGRLLCNGQAVSRTDYAALFAKVGTTYGDGNGTSTFNVPDYRDKFPMGAGTTALAVTGGANSVTLTEAQLPEVQLDAYTGYSDGSFGSVRDCLQTVDNGAAYRTSNDPGNPYIKAFGSGEAHENRPAFVACYVYVKT
jgi:microcystin-dependent protein